MATAARRAIRDNELSESIEVITKRSDEITIGKKLLPL